MMRTGIATQMALALLLASGHSLQLVAQRPRASAAVQRPRAPAVLRRRGVCVCTSSDDNLNPYRVSKADRMRAKYGDAAVVGTSAPREQVEDQLAADLEKFKAEKGLTGKALAGPGSSATDGERTLLQKVIDVLGTILTYNFAIICTFFAWFLAGVAAQFGAQQTAIIEAFRSAWDVLILPLLSTHMALTFLSAGLERLPTANDES